MMQKQVLNDGTEVLVSDEKIQTLHFFAEGEDKPSKYGVILTNDMKEAIMQTKGEQIANKKRQTS